MFDFQGSFGSFPLEVKPKILQNCNCNARNPGLEAGCVFRCLILKFEKNEDLGKIPNPFPESMCAAVYGVAPWLATKSSGSKTRHSRPRMTIKYPKLYAAAQQIDDPEWRKLLEATACDSPPKGFSFESGDVFVYKKGTRQQRLQLSEDPEESILEIQDFIRIHKFKSKRDVEEEQEKIRECRLAQSCRQITSWKQAKVDEKKRLQEWFVQQMKEEFDLKPTEVLELRQTLFLGVLLDGFNDKTIHMENSMIAEIEGLEFDPEKRVWYADIPLMSPPVSRPSHGGGYRDTPMLKTYQKALESFLKESGSGKYSRSFRPTTRIKTDSKSQSG